MKLSRKEQLRLRTAYGPWALITGASSGIGHELAAQLAEAGFNLIINARNESTLNAIANQLSQQYSQDVRVVAADLAQAMGVQQLIEATNGVEIGLLVASAGYGTSGLFITNPVASEIDMVRVNCEALLALAHHFGKRFAQQGRGGLILMSSLVAFQGVPYSANYAATKAYVQSLAEGLARELKPNGVDVLAAAPGPVTSGFGGRANMVMTMALTPEQVGVPILQALGRQTTVLPGFLTKLLTYSLRMVPRWAKVRIMQQVMRGMTAHQV